MTTLMVRDWKKSVLVDCFSVSVRVLMPMERARLMIMMISVMTTDTTLNRRELTDNALESLGWFWFMLYCSTFSPTTAPKEMPSSTKVARKVTTRLGSAAMNSTPRFSQTRSFGLGAVVSLICTWSVTGLPMASMPLV